MDPIGVTQLSEMLQIYGGWGVASVSIVGIWILVRKLLQIQKEHSDKLIELVKETNTTIQALTNALRGGH